MTLDGTEESFTDYFMNLNSDFSNNLLNEELFNFDWNETGMTANDANGESFPINNADVYCDFLNQLDNQNHFKDWLSPTSSSERWDPSASASMPATKRRRTEESPPPFSQSMISTMSCDVPLNEISCLHVSSCENYHIRLSTIRNSRCTFNLDSKTKDNISSLFNSRKGFVQASPLTMKSILDYFSSKDIEDEQLSFYTPRVGQKSYGNEKRFFTPFPQAILKTKLKVDSQLNGDQFETSLTSTISTEAYEKSPHHGSVFLRELESVVAFKNMHISDLQKLRENQFKSFAANDNCLQSFLGAIGLNRIKKDFDFYLTLSTPGNGYLGSFRSDIISLISKPSKRKTATGKSKASLTSRPTRDELGAPHQELIMNGFEISMFNRVKSQTVSTKYLYLKNSETLVANNLLWEPFTINVISPEVNKGKPILFGSVVILESSRTRWKSSPMIIRLVDQKSSDVACSNSVDYLSHLQKITFQLYSDTSKFLCINSTAGSEPRVSFLQSYQNGVSDGAIWTAVGVTSTKYKWWAKSLFFKFPVSPIPKVQFSNFHYSSSNNEGTLLFLETALEAHSVLRALIEAKDLNCATITEKFDKLLSYDIFLGNVPLEAIVLNKALISDSKNVFKVDFLDQHSEIRTLLQLLNKISGRSQLSENAEYILDDIVFSYAVKIPCLSTLFRKGGWKKDLPYSIYNGHEEGIENLSSLDKDDEANCINLNIGFPKLASAEVVDNGEHEERCCRCFFSNVGEKLKLSLPLILVRRIDGVIYRTDQTVTFETSLN